MQRLEAEFPEHPLLPSDESKRADVKAIIKAFDELQAAAFQYVVGGPMVEGVRDPSKLPALKAAFEEQLASFESLIGKHGGPYLAG